MSDDVDTATGGQLAEEFATRLRAAQGSCSFASDADAACGVLRRLVAAEGPQARVVVAPEVERLLPRVFGRLAATVLSAKTRRDEFSGASVVVTTAKLLIAATGSVMLSGSEVPTRTATALAQRHVVIATTDQIVADLAAALEHAEPAASSWYTFVTGPSRTADIEKRLVLGAHGPVALDVVILETVAAE